MMLEQINLINFTKTRHYYTDDMNKQFFYKILISSTISLNKK